MKKILFKSAFLVVLLLNVTIIMAQDKEKERAEPKFKKTKSYTKSYSLGSNDKINLENQFGEMKLITWDKNEVKVDVSITGKSDEEDRAQTILDRISISDGKDGNSVFFKTKMENQKSDWNNKKGNYNEGMEINYTVYLPSGNPLKANNQFGKMIVPDYKGEAELESKFGSLTAGKITNAKEVSVEFGKADIAQITGGKLSIKFSNGTVNKLSGDVKSNLEFSKVKLNIDNDAKTLTINNSYSTVYLDLDKSFSATYDVTTSHGSFSNESSFEIKKEGEKNDNHYGPEFTKHYTGTSGSGSSKIKVSSSFGEIIAGHNMTVDMTEKRKNKSTRSI